MIKLDKELFSKAIYDIVKTIPHGRVTSYGAIAKAAGYGNLSRLVGRIMSECGKTGEDIPAHRVVNSKGELSGRHAFSTSGEMPRRLEA